MSAVSAAATGSTRPGEVYLDEMLRLLWPTSDCNISRGRPNPATSYDQAFAVLPHPRAPRMLVPRGNPTVAAAALRNFKPSNGGLKLRFLEAVTRAGALSALSSGRVVRTVSADPEASIHRYLTARLEQQHLMSLYIGPVRAVQKPIIQLQSEDGSATAFVKVGANELTNGLVAREARALQALTAARLSELRVPAILHEGQWRSHVVLVQEPLLARDQQVADDALNVRAMVEVAAIGRHRHTLASSPFWTNLIDRAWRLPATPAAQLIRATLESLPNHALSTTLDFGGSHGDWAPWNITQDKGRVLAWDWEHFSKQVPCGFDAIHHLVQGSVVVNGTPVDSAFTRAYTTKDPLLEPFGLPAPRRQLAILLYALHIATQYLHDGESRTKMSHLDEWLDPVIREGLAALEDPGESPA